jgi:hypothetical protein
MSEKWEDLSTVADKMHLQWFADDEPPMDFVDVGGDDDDDEPEIVVLADGQEPPPDEPAPDPEKEALQQQLADLQSRVNNNNELGTIIGQQIANAVGNRGEQQDQPVQQPGETDEEFAKRFEEEVFKPGKALSLIQEAVFRTAARPFNQLVGITTEQSKQLLKLDPVEGPVFTQYEKEIESMKRKLPIAEQNDPKVYQKLLGQVKAVHPEANQAQFNQAVEQKVQETLRSLGIDPSAPKPKSKPTFTESGGARGGGGTAPPGKRRVYVKESDRREAMRLGIDIRTYMEDTYGR